MNIEVFESIYSEFKAWLMGIEEDDPLEPEIRFIYFLLREHENMCELLYAGCEVEKKPPVSFDYYPLEAQFFWCKSFMNLAMSEALNTLEIMVKNLIEEQPLNMLFKSKEVFVGEVDKIPLVHFKVK